MDGDRLGGIDFLLVGFKVAGLRVGSFEGDLVLEGERLCSFTIEFVGTLETEDLRVGTNDSFSVGNLEFGREVRNFVGDAVFIGIIEGETEGKSTNVSIL